MPEETGDDDAAELGVMESPYYGRMLYSISQLESRPKTGSATRSDETGST
jgi:hypothetical protein